MTSLCSTTYGYSFNQLFKINYLTGDTLILGHEIGHNLGSPHTHCYPTPRPDQCYGSEAGCYSGPTSCPGQLVINGVTSNGTLMSYCHLSELRDTTLVFHPQTVNNYIGPQLSSRRRRLHLSGRGRPDPDAHTDVYADADTNFHADLAPRHRPTSHADTHSHADASPTRTPTSTPTPTPRQLAP